MKGPSEAQIQIFFFNWLAYAYPLLRPLCFAIPNGGRRDKREAVNLKRGGVVPGVPDIFFAYPTENGYGLFIELKSSTGKLSKLQDSMIKRLTLNGYRCVICYSGEEAIQAFETYIGK